MKRVVIAGTSSEVGKTTIATGIMKALSKKYNVQGYKVGPDYIDPTYHTIATGNYSRNLDSFFMNKKQIKYLFQKHSKNKDISIIEGVRGLYEGLSIKDDTGSTASIAKILDAPVILIVNAKSLTKSAIAIIRGFMELDKDVKIKGVIFNFVRGEGHINKLKEAMQYYLPNIEIIGFIPRKEGLKLESRHLGLIPTPENMEFKNKIEKIGEIIEEYLDIDKIIDIADEDFDEVDEVYLWEIEENYKKVAIAYDEAFNFYYYDNFDALKENKAELIFFSPLRDEMPDADVLYIGGGYPEIFKEKLSKNKELIEQIREFDGYIYAECGGLMYLTKAIDDCKMVGLIDAKAIMTDKVQGLSYVKAKILEDCIVGKKDRTIKGHEFHYSKLIGLKDKRFAFKILRGRGIGGYDGIIKKNVLAGYLHNHAVANPYFASSMVNFEG
ncbi:cobyrinic acid a,c-diamide synthase [Methanocaldococcus villosus KIN24-T80]|uniref:Cobyrinate a,c-diamide synthase n=1 Tax=Methanocaldococcus villosus KIN24-T80 TaxID=1069083 RepID=N6V3E3_9EURY|nr:Ni-sirohydrochlorin a,c-diamide synthase [Methanocaldococcus villosus]ENN96783.1 cobyrinic acid a,c-diamide synthase [Methanocaldococcus villosus KIN24-T80]